MQTGLVGAGLMGHGGSPWWFSSPTPMTSARPSPPEPARAGDDHGDAFSLANAHKDMSYYMAPAGERGLSSAMADHIMAVYDKTMAGGHGGCRVSRLIDPELNQD